MNNLLDKVLEWVAKNYSKDASKMLIITGVAGWTLSSLAQIFGILFNPKIPKEQKSYLIPQEFADAVVNIGSFFLITQVTKATVAKLFSTGKFASGKVREFLNKNKALYADKIGKINFDLDEIRKVNHKFPTKEYFATKNYYTTLATVGAGIVSSNIVTPILRNKMASKMHKNYVEVKKNESVKKEQTFKGINSTQAKYTIYPSNGLKI